MQAIDQLTTFLRHEPSLPNVLHAHYADAAYVCSKVCSILELPMVLTPHSLGRLKLCRLLDQNYTPDEIVSAATQPVCARLIAWVTECSVRNADTD